MLNLTFKSKLLACAGATSIVFAGSVPAFAQDSDSGEGLDVIIVTAQKREQSQQDVPIAVTAISADVLEANRVTTLVDLSSLAPGLTMRLTPGGSSIPTFGIRGALGQGSVTGSDKQVSNYLDGVYLASPRGSIFDLPDTERIEVLRGPQGTLFGRNATAGAVSITTREPVGEARVRATATIGNRDHYRFRLSAETPQVGAFSAYFSYVHDEYRGDIRNANPGVVWDRSNALTGGYFLKGADWLGSKNSDSYFASVKYEPSDQFKLVYKFDYNTTVSTPAGVALTGYDPNSSLGSLYSAMIESQTGPVYIASNQRRPKVVNNSYSAPGSVKQEGHNLTATWQVSDQISVKNIAAYRKSSISSQASLVGIDALETTLPGLTAYVSIFIAPRVPGFSSATPEQKQAIIQGRVNGLVAAGALGAPFVFLGSNPVSRAEQWSDELQVNYDTDFLTLTLGGLYFKSKDAVNEHGFNTTSYSIVTGPIAVNRGPQFAEAESIAAYGQAELHLTPQIDITLGARLTHDNKSGRTDYGDPANFSSIESSYKDTRFNYLIGANYKPNDDILIYGKWSTAYVSGGSVGPVAFEPETAKSAEAGIKADLLDRRLRTNLAVYWVQYKNYQTSQSQTTLGALVNTIVPDATVRSALGSFIFPQGDVEAKGFELEVTAAPVDGFTLGGSVSYTDTSFSNVPDFIKASQNLPLDTPDSEVRPTVRPKWTGSAWPSTIRRLCSETHI